MNMKQILGLDLGSSSIGWAIVYEDDSLKNKIVDMGCRIIPLSTDDANQFSKGQTITKNAERTQKRTQRKGYNRYQLRRQNLLIALTKLGMMYDETLVSLRSIELWGMRARAAREQISLSELGRVLFHLNQKRGYRSAKGDATDKKQSAYLQAITDRYMQIKQQDITIGEFLYSKLVEDSSFRCKDNIFPRAAYVEEFDRIISIQKLFYPQILTDDVINELRNRIIYYQRPLKSCKHLVASCELEKRSILVNGKTISVAPKVAPRSAPLFQVCKIWESINNIILENRTKDRYHITIDKKLKIFEFMNTHEKLKVQDLYKLLGIKKSDGWYGGRALGTGLQGNVTRCAIANALQGYENIEELLRFDLSVVDSEQVDTETGEIIPIIDAKFEDEPLNRLWHTLYSISDQEELCRVLIKNFGITNEETLNKLCCIDFVKIGYGNKSTRAIRRLLPFLLQGYMYSEASSLAGYECKSLTKAENESRELLSSIKLLDKGALRQPIVEKILNQMINVVNALIEKYGKFDEIRIELARELKQSKEEREQATKSMNANQRENEKNAALIKEYGLTPTRSRLQKYKMWKECNGICMYCGQPVNVKQFLQGFEVEVEHVIPKSLLFDDSFSNKVCACRKCNQEKNNRTAYDYMKSKDETKFQNYVDRVNEYFREHKISKAKYDKLLMSATEIPDDFINRQLRESQYIARKAKEILQSVCYNVYATSGSVTDFLRHTWGWDTVLHTLNLPRYKKGGLTEIVDVEHKGQKYTEERIAGWSKRLDHRHHALDALTIACTKQGYIQRLNNLSSLKDVPFETVEKQGDGYRDKLSRLERYIISQPHFTTAEVLAAIENILVSFKVGKRVATLGKRYIQRGGKRVAAQTGIIVPRGALSEESVYGCIKKQEKDKKGNIRYTDEFVMKYPLSAIDSKCVKDIVDKRIRDIVDARLKSFVGDEKKAFDAPLQDHQGNIIRSVRCRTGLSPVSVASVRYNSDGEPIAFVKPGNNHHVAIYCDKNGEWKEHIVTFWHAVERKKNGLPVVIENTSAAWEMVTDKMSESFQALLPEPNMHLQYSMQQNDMFVMGMSDDEYYDALRNEDYVTLSKNLYRVQKISSGAYVFRKHSDTQTDDKYIDVDGKRKFNLEKSRLIETVFWISSLRALQKLNPHKVQISVIGKIVEK